MSIIKIQTHYELYLKTFFPFLNKYFILSFVNISHMTQGRLHVSLSIDVYYYHKGNTDFKYYNHL